MEQRILEYTNMYPTWWNLQTALWFRYLLMWPQNCATHIESRCACMALSDCFEAMGKSMTTCNNITKITHTLFNLPSVG
jgi:hypothetical protein